MCHHSYYFLPKIHKLFIFPVNDKNHLKKTFTTVFPNALIHRDP